MPGHRRRRDPAGGATALVSAALPSLAGPNVAAVAAPGPAFSPARGEKGPVGGAETTADLGAEGCGLLRRRVGPVLLSPCGRERICVTLAQPDRSCKSKRGGRGTISWPSLADPNAATVAAPGPAFSPEGGEKGPVGGRDGAPKVAISAPDGCIMGATATSRDAAMSLKVELKPGEKLIIGNCVVTNAEQRTRLYIDGKAPILREKDILTPETADSPARRIYFAVQLMYIDEDVERLRTSYF